MCCAGVSAGGVGVMNLADGIYSTVQPKAPALSNFKGFVDGGAPIVHQRAFFT